jgi:hypothetical protein
MKLLCISTKSKGKNIYTNITVGKIYEGNSYDKSTYMIRDDKEEVSLYPKKNFQNTEQLRDSKINKILK